MSKIDYKKMCSVLKQICLNQARMLENKTTDRFKLYKMRSYAEPEKMDEEQKHLDEEFKKLSLEVRELEAQLRKLNEAGREDLEMTADVEGEVF